MDIRHLRQIVSIHQSGSFGRASHALGVSQPTLSKNISRLEDELGFKLFERTASGAAATPLGAHVIRRAERMIADATLLNRELELVSSGDAGRVSIGVGPVLATILLPELAKAFVRHYPKLNFRMMVEPRNNLINGIQNGTFDLILLAQGDDLNDLDLSFTPIAIDPIIAVSTPDHVLAGRPSITVEEFRTHPCATSASTAQFELTKVLGFEPAALDSGGVYISNDYGVIRTLALSGAATALGPAHAFKQELAIGLLVSLDLDLDVKLNIVAAMTAAATHWSVLTKIASVAREVSSRVFHP